ncbi:hypothetical protein AMD27_04545 [Acinetobacter sp. TGL-Y2]|uniref:hypothetical protein n=1 Tax=Acinetobacter sp. TGL-Y2 TaxID=1407071 RepID=UPI0007A668BD|nr:hypothetical protein [Acinetobacter sp. TGL-Y2]AMW78231.1 hypothetical protein AMD27_04545 [Acinetobacter sp. TGL-Y2]
MNLRRALELLCVITPVISLIPISAYAKEALQPLTDTELSDVNGQALMSMSYIAPNDAANKMSGQGMGFYKLGLEAEMELNANIKKLQLGCGGMNGAGGCDIDIDNLSLSGIADTRDGRVGSSAKLTNPFLEFAIKNPNSASQREMVGFRLSAEKALGLLTLGDENTDGPNGINQLSGALKIKATTGTAVTAARSMTYADTDMKINGKIKLLGSLLQPDFDTNDYNLQLQSTNANLAINGTTIYGTRMESAKLTGSATISDLNFGGDINASVKVPLISLLPLTINANGYISGLRANLDIDEDLGFIHKLPLNNPFSLSLQTNTVHWPGAEYAANRGWWLAIEDQIDIGQVNPSNPIEVTNDILKQVVPSISNYLTNNPPNCPLGSCLIAGLNIGQVNLSSANPLYFPIKDLKLATQNFAPNCYGNLKFC